MTSGLSRRIRSYENSIEKAEKSELMHHPLQEVVKGWIYSKVCSVLVCNLGR